MEKNTIFRIPEIKLTYKPSADLFGRPVIHNSEEAYKLFVQIWEKESFYLVEHFHVLFLNRGSKVLGVWNMSRGGTSAVLVDLKLLMIAALKSNASSIIVAHNHPSGRAVPSESDIHITTKINQACNYMDISLNDHLILAHDTYYSFNNEGLL